MIHRIILCFGFLLTTLVGLGQTVPPRPNPPRLVNDLVGMLSQSQIETLERKLVAYDDTTSSQITIAIVPSVKPYDMNQYATALGREWGVGQKGKNNGIVLLWSPEDRKVYIATGYGLEGAIPDAVAKTIVDQVIIPYFREVKYFEGLDKGTDAIFKYASGEYDAEPQAEGDFGFGFILLMFLLMIIIFYIMSRGNKGGGRGYRQTSGWPYTTYTGWGTSSGNWGGGGWSGGGGDFGGGGGGFGGFGGGSFGGGGAGGDY